MAAGAHLPWGVYPIAKPYTRLYNYGVSYNSEQFNPEVAGNMKRASTPRNVAPSEAEKPNLSAESVRLPPENIPEAERRTTRAPDERPERSGVSYYVQHWGINE